MSTTPTSLPNSCSLLEAFTTIEDIFRLKVIYEYVDQNRSGDHICYISDLHKMKAHYPAWYITTSLDDILRRLYNF
jgi:CDP-paratose 2-epimerase